MINLTTYKTPLISGVIGLTVGAGLVFFLKSQPKEKIVIQTQQQIVYKDRLVARDVIRTIIKNKDGSSTETFVDKSKSDTSVSSKTDITNTTVIRNQANYNIQLNYSQPLNNLVQPFSVTNLQVMGGMRILNLPVFVQLGTDFKLNSAIIGFSIEF